MILFSNFGFTGFNNVLLTPQYKKETSEESKEQNIFSNPLQQPQEDLFKKSTKHLNDYDTDIFVVPEDMIPDDSIRWGVKIDKTEKELTKVHGQIDAIKTLELEEKLEKLDELEQKRKQLELELQGYREEYRNLGLMYKITDVVCDISDKTKNKLDQAKIAFTSNAAVSKLKLLIPGMRQKEELSLTLNKFCKVQANLSGMLSKSVNPFVDAESKAQEFVALMTVANKLDAKAGTVLSSFKDTKSRLAAYYGAVKAGLISKVVLIKDKVAAFTSNKLSG